MSRRGAACGGVLAVLAMLPACAQPVRRAAPAAGDTPTLVVLIAVDQLRADYLERFAPHFSGGYARLLREGAVFTSAFQDHAMTATAPGHATMLSGREPVHTGIVRNEEGVPDPQVRLLSRDARGASPWRFRGTTLADWLQAAAPLARVLSISRKDRGAILPVGRGRHEVYWMDRGVFTTSTWYATALPAWVAAYNAGRLPEVLGDSTWWPLLPESAFAEPDDQPWEHNGADRVFPHRRPNPWPQGDRDYEVTPAIDQATLELAMRGVRTLDLGRGPHTDLLVVSLSGTDHIGHAFGPYSREVRDQAARVDHLLGAFLDTLFAERGPRRVVVALTADHGVTPQPEWSAAHGRPGGRMDADSFVRLLDARFDSAFGPGRWIRYLEKGLLVLEADTIAARGVDPAPLLAAFAGEARRLPGVARVDTRASLAAADTAADWAARRWIRSLPADLPAGLMISVRPGWVFRGARVEASHGHVTDDDAQVPLILWGANVRPGRYEARVAVADLGPTLARLAGVTPSEPLDGRVLVEALR